MVYKSELQQLLYPIFAYCYLDLVIHNDPESPINNPKSFFHLSSSFNQNEDLKKLSLVETKYHVYENEYTSSLLRDKQIIKLSSPSYQLLQKFIMDENLCFLYGIIQERLIINAYAEPGAFDEFNPQLDPTVLSQLRKKRTRDGQEKRSIERFEFTSIEDENRYEINWRPMEIIESEKHAEAERFSKELGDTMDAAKEIKKGPSVCFFTFFNCKDEINSILVAPQKKTSVRTGPTIFSGNNDSTIKTWNWCDNTKLDGFQLDEPDEEEFGVKYSTLIGHSGPVYGLSLSEDHEWLLSSSEDTTVRLWNRSGSNVVVYKGHQFPVWDVKFSPVNSIFATASHDRTAKLWSTDRVTPIRIFAGHTDDVSVVCFHPNGNYVATGSYDRTVRLWDVNSGTQVRLLNGHTEPVRSLSFSRNGKFLATGGADGRVVVWDIAQGRRLHTFADAHTQPVWSVCFSNDSTILASSSLDQSIRIWDLTANQHSQDHQEKISKSHLITTYYTKNTPVYTMSYLNDRDIILAAGSFDDREEEEEEM